MKRIVIVDDEPMVIRVLRLALEKEGYRVDSYPNGEAALQAVLAEAPDLMITDIEMPKMSGQELCLQLRQQMPDRKFPIMVSTSLTAMEHRKWSKDIPDLIFMEKPISARHLTAALSKLFNQSSVSA